MANTLPMPDVEAVVVAVLRTASVCDGRVYSAVPAVDPEFPLAVVQRLGGVPTEKRKLDNARIQIDLWGALEAEDGKADARDEADAARVALFEAESQIFDDFDAQVTCVEDETGLMWAPDAEIGRARYIASYMVYAQNSRPVGS